MKTKAKIKARINVQEYALRTFLVMFTIFVVYIALNPHK